jgi:hypothetical protein
VAIADVIAMSLYLPRAERHNHGKAGIDPMIDRRAVLPRLVAAWIAALAPHAFAQASCADPQKPMRDIELMLGRTASDARWKRFLAREVTPRFPDGLTVYETTGQWRDPRTGIFRRERSRVLRVIVSDDAAVRQKVTAVAEAYKTQFRQTSVGIIMRDVCASF